jgi:hypothetical protein
MNELKDFKSDGYEKNDGDINLITISLLQKILSELQKLNAK